MTPPEYEEEILRAIADGLAYNRLCVAQDWAPEDVDQVLAQHQLEVTAGGTIVPAGVAFPVLRRLADESPSMHVRQAAARAGTAMVALANALARDHAAQTAEGVRRARKAAVAAWLDELHRLEHAAQAELRRLTRTRPRSRRAG